MAKRLKVSEGKTSNSYYVIDDYTNPQTKRNSTAIVEKLGNSKYLKEKYHTDSEEEVVRLLNEYIDELKRKDKLDNASVSISLNPNKLIDKDKTRLYNIGYLYPRNILSSLGIKKICDDIKSTRKFEYDLSSIICDLVCTRIIYPGSKKSSYTDAFNFLKVPEYELEDIYRSLRVLSENRYEIEKGLYINSSDLFKRNTTVLYYDCTNFYFEAEEENDFIKYSSASKEHRPNPIVQYGLFMDNDGIPLADIVYEGNKNEQFSLRALEERIEKDFKHSRFVVCADAGLNGFDNKIYNDKKDNGAYIVTKPMKKMNKVLLDWALDTKGWKVLGHKGTYDISNLKDTVILDNKTYKTNDIIFYKSRWVKERKKSEVNNNEYYELEEQYILTYSTKYKEYQRYIRQKKIERANKLINNPNKIKTSNNNRDPKYYIESINVTDNGEVANETVYKINESIIKDEEKLDGLYCVTTDLEDKDIGLIIKANKQRWEIEESFEIMKSELKTRPMYVTHKQAIEGHLLICFIALLVYRILEKKYLNEEYTCNTLIKHLRKLNITHLGDHNYIPSFTRTDLTDRLAEVFGFQPSKEVLTQIYLNKFIKVVNSKKGTKLK